MHLDIEKVVAKKNIPAWKGKPAGDGPFHWTACGHVVKPDITTTDKKAVDCRACKRTRVFRGVTLPIITKAGG
jgi:hypothetical protein